jgi:hypothetical protein
MGKGMQNIFLFRFLFFNLFFSFLEKMHVTQELMALGGKLDSISTGSKYRYFVFTHHAEPSKVLIMESIHYDKEMKIKSSLQNTKDPITTANGFIKRKSIPY